MPASVTCSLQRIYGFVFRVHSRAIYVRPSLFRGDIRVAPSRRTKVAVPFKSYETGESRKKEKPLHGCEVLFSVTLVRNFYPPYSQTSILKRESHTHPISRSAHKLSRSGLHDDFTSTKSPEVSCHTSERSGIRSRPGPDGKSHVAHVLSAEENKRPAPSNALIVMLALKPWTHTWTAFRLR